MYFINISRNASELITNLTVPNTYERLIILVFCASIHSTYVFVWVINFVCILYLFIDFWIRRKCELC